MTDTSTIPSDFAACILGGVFHQEPAVAAADPNEPTDEQKELYNELVDMMMGDLYSAEGEEKARLNAEYSEKRDRILAINPNVHAGIADPDGFEFYHNIHKSEYGFRPRGYITYAAMREDIERIRRTAENITFDPA